jgi:hypothetical protein
LYNNTKDAEGGKLISGMEEMWELKHDVAFGENRRSTKVCGRELSAHQQIPPHVAG